MAELNGQLIGLATVGPPEDENVAAQLQLYRVHILAEHYGCGAASRMLPELLGDRPALLWVFKDNPRTVAFYRKHGFEPDGAEKDLGAEENDEALRGILEIRTVRGRPDEPSAGS